MKELGTKLIVVLLCCLWPSAVALGADPADALLAPQPLEATEPLSTIGRLGSTLTYYSNLEPRNKIDNAFEFEVSVVGITTVESVHCQIVDTIARIVFEGTVELDSVLSLALDLPAGFSEIQYGLRATCDGGADAETMITLDPSDLYSVVEAAEPIVADEIDWDYDGLIGAMDLCPHLSGDNLTGCPVPGSGSENYIPNDNIVYVDPCVDPNGPACPLTPAELESLLNTQYIQDGEIFPSQWEDPDSDGDGIPLGADLCPEVYGVPPTGCPEDPFGAATPEDACSEINSTQCMAEPMTTIGQFGTTEHYYNVWNPAILEFVVSATSPTQRIEAHCRIQDNRGEIIHNGPLPLDEVIPFGVFLPDSYTGTYTVRATCEGGADTEITLEGVDWGPEAEEALELLNALNEDPDQDGVPGAADLCPSIYGTDANGCPENLMETPMAP